MCSNPPALTKPAGRIYNQAGDDGMNIQIFGTKKSQDTRKAQMFFKERRIPFQYVDMKEKGLSRGELSSVIQACGGPEKILETKLKDDTDAVTLQYLVDSQKTDFLFEHQEIIKLPVVRNGKQATVGYEPEIWKKWQ